MEPIFSKINSILKQIFVTLDHAILTQQLHQNSVIWLMSYSLQKVFFNITRLTTLESCDFNLSHIQANEILLLYNF